MTMPGSDAPDHLTTWRQPTLESPCDIKRHSIHTQRALEIMRVAVYFLEQACDTLADPSGDKSGAACQERMEAWWYDIDHAHSAAVAGLQNLIAMMEESQA